MTQKRINGVLSMGWEEANPVQGQPPIYKTGFRGEVHDFPESVVEAKKLERVLVHYPAPPGEALSVARYEPVLVDPDGGDEFGDAAKADAEIRELEAKVAQLRATRPPAPRPYDVPKANEVILAPSTTGTRLVGDVEAPLGQGVRLQAPQTSAEPKAEAVTLTPPAVEVEKPKARQQGR